MEPFVRILLNPPEKRSPLDRFCVQNEWFMRNWIPPDPSKFVPEETIFVTDLAHTTLHHVEEPIIGFPYVQIVGTEHETAAARLREAIPVYTDEEIFRFWDEAASPTDAERAISMVGVVAPERADSSFTQRLLQGLSHSHAKVRLAAILAVGYRGWPVFKEKLAGMRSSDPDEQVRMRAGNMLTAMNNQTSQANDDEIHVSE